MDWSGSGELDIAGKQLIPRLGRRNNQNQSSLIEQDTPPDSPESASASASASAASLKRPSSKGPAPVAPPLQLGRARRAGAAWGDEVKSAKQKGGLSGTIDSDRFMNDYRNSKEDDIPVIPDIDDIIEDTGNLDLSKAPSKGINRAAAVAAYQELGSDLIKNKLFSTLDGVDLSLLMEKLYPEHLVKEPDQVWSWESLFTQVAAEINSEAQSKVDDKTE